VRGRRRARARPVPPAAKPDPDPARLRPCRGVRRAAQAPRVGAEVETKPIVVHSVDHIEYDKNVENIIKQAECTSSAAARHRGERWRVGLQLAVKVDHARPVIRRVRELLENGVPDLSRNYLECEPVRHDEAVDPPRPVPRARVPTTPPRQQAPVSLPLSTGSPGRRTRTPSSPCS